MIEVNENIRNTLATLPKKPGISTFFFIGWSLFENNIYYRLNKIYKYIFSFGVNNGWL